jgi:hypothetical protein
MPARVVPIAGINAATDFSSADYAGGLELSFWGLDDFLVSPEELAVIGGVDALTGSPVVPAVDFEFGANGSPPRYRRCPRRHRGHHPAGI